MEDRLVPSLAGAVLKILAEPCWQQNASVYGPAFVSKRFGQSRMVRETIALYGPPTTPKAVLPENADKLRTAQLRQAWASRINQLQVLIAGERQAAAARLRELESTLSAERRAFVARIRELERSLDDERRAQAEQIAEMQSTLVAERDAFVARIRELERSLDDERRAQAEQIAEMQSTLVAERDAFVARIRELEGSLDDERRAQADQIAEMQSTFVAERDAFVARIRELERSLEKSARWFGIGALVAAARRWVPVHRDTLLVVGVTPTGNRDAGKFAADATQLPTGSSPLAQGNPAAAAYVPRARRPH